MKREKNIKGRRRMKFLMSLFTRPALVEHIVIHANILLIIKIGFKPWNVFTARLMNQPGSRSIRSITPLGMDGL